MVSALVITPRVCKSFTPQPPGKVDRSVDAVKHASWPGVCFTDLKDLNRQAAHWCRQVNARMHGTTHQRPVDRWEEEGLRPVPEGWAWERFTSEERQVSWDGYVSFDGVLYGLPSASALAGRRVQVNARHGELSVWSQGQLVLRVATRSQSGKVGTHPEQFPTVLPARPSPRPHVPRGHPVVSPA